MVILALDYGDRRIGAAISDALEIAAHGLPNIENDGTDAPVESVAAIVQEKDVEIIVLGMPTRMDGSTGRQVHKVNGFIKRLKARLPGLPIETMDERLTSAQAHRALSTQGASIQRRARNVDRMAAQIILTRYLRLRESRQRDEQRRGEGE